MKLSSDSVQADGFDLSRPLRWGFFFAHSSHEPLERVVAELDGHDYVHVTAPEKGGAGTDAAHCTCAERTTTGNASPV